MPREMTETFCAGDKKVMGMKIVALLRFEFMTMYIRREGQVTSRPSG